MLGGIGLLIVLYLVCAELLKRVAVAPSVVGHGTNQQSGRALSIIPSKPLTSMR